MSITEAQYAIAQGYPVGGRRKGETQFKAKYRADEVVYIYNPSTQEDETAGSQVLASLEVWWGGVWWVTASDLEKDLSLRKI